MKRAIQISDTPQVPRGMFATNDRLYFVYDRKLYYRTASGVDGVITGNLTGSTVPVTFAVNLRPTDSPTYPGPNVILIEGDGLGAWMVDELNSILVPYPDADLPFVTSVEYYAGYFFFVSPTNDMYASDLQNPEIPDFSNARAEYRPTRCCGSRWTARCSWRSGPAPSRSGSTSARPAGRSPGRRPSTPGF